MRIEKNPPRLIISGNPNNDEPDSNRADYFLKNKPDSRVFLILNNLAFVVFDFRSIDQPIPHKIVFLSYNLAR